MGQTDLGEKGNDQGLIHLFHRCWLLRATRIVLFLLDEWQTGTKVPSSPKIHLLFPFSISGAFTRKGCPSFHLSKNTSQGPSISKSCLCSVARLTAVYHKGPLSTFYGNQKATGIFVHLCPKRVGEELLLPAPASPSPPSAPTGPLEPLCFPSPTACCPDPGDRGGGGGQRWGHCRRLAQNQLWRLENLTLSLPAHDYPP